MKIKTLSNGKIEATARMESADVRREERHLLRNWAACPNAREQLYVAWEPCEMPAAYYPIDGTQRQINVGDEGCLQLSNSVSPSALRSGQTNNYRLSLYMDERGIPGNTDGNIQRLHGWRGTSNDNCIYADGWRRVESIKRVSRGLGFCVTFSADMRADRD